MKVFEVEAAGIMATAGTPGRQELLSIWYVSPAGRQLFADPFVRGNFAAAAGLSEAELGNWNKSYA